MKFFKNIFSYSLFLVFLLSVTACGGGGGGEATKTDTSTGTSTNTGSTTTTATTATTTTTTTTTTSTTSQTTTTTTTLPQCVEDDEQCCIGDVCVGIDLSCSQEDEPIFLGCDDACEPIVDCGEAQQSECSEPIIFEYPPFDLDGVAYILPMGGMTGGHVTPIDHQYYIGQGNGGNEQWVDVIAPGDGVITDVQHMNEAVGDPPISIDDFRLVIQHTCSVASIYIHVDELSDRVAEVAPPLGEYARVNLPVEGGEVIGRYKGSVDYNIWDTDVHLDFIVPEHYLEEWKMHVPDTNSYYITSIREQMISKSIRTVEPIGGKIDYDIDGRLVGNWFEVGTNYYQGLNPDRYWAGHLTVAYDNLDPSRIVVSIGTYEDTSAQFGVVGNAPDPANVGVGEFIEWELISYDYMTNGYIWDRTSLVQDITTQEGGDVLGVVLFELQDDRSLKMETFPNQRASQVNGFTDNARLFER